VVGKVRLDHAGIRQILTGDTVRELITDAAEQVAAAARAQGHTITSGEPVPVEVVPEADTDRAGVSVAVQHASGIGMEARHGLLRRAAETIGLDPKEPRE
jgi:hypothetical protein